MSQPRSPSPAQATRDRPPLGRHSQSSPPIGSRTPLPTLANTRGNLRAEPGTWPHVARSERTAPVPATSTFEPDLRKPGPSMPLGARRPGGQPRQLATPSRSQPGGLAAVAPPKLLPPAASASPVDAAEPMALPQPPPGVWEPNYVQQQQAATRRAACAVCAGAVAVTAGLAGVGWLTASVALPWGKPTIWTSVGMGIVSADAYLCLSSKVPTWAAVAVHGAFLALQVAAFGTTPLPTLCASMAMGVGLGLAPSLLLALPSATAQGARQRVTDAVEALWQAAGLYASLPLPTMCLLYEVRRGISWLPVLFGLAVPAQALMLSHLAARTTLRLAEERVATMAEGRSPATWLSEVADAARALEAPAVALALAVGCAVGTPWRQWLESRGRWVSGHLPAGMPGRSPARGGPAAHEGAPLAWALGRAGAFRAG